METKTKKANSEIISEQERTIGNSSEIIVHGAGNFHVYQLKENELTKIEEICKKSSLTQVFWFFLPTTITIAIAITTTNMNKLVYKWYLIALILSSVFTIISGAIALSNCRERKKFFKNIRER